MYNEVCVGVCTRCGRQIRSNYTHRNQKLYCTMCNQPIEYTIAYEIMYY